jgi:hypothetical protein
MNLKPAQAELGTAQHLARHIGEVLIHCRKAQHAEVRRVVPGADRGQPVVDPRHLLGVGGGRQDQHPA